MTVLLRQEQRVAGRPVTVVRPTSGWRWPDLPELWERRELLYFFAWRDVKVRYAQTAFGAAWTVSQPLVLALIFTLAFRRIGRISTGDLPYPVFAIAGLTFWTFFARAVSRGSDSLISNSQLLTKISLPRILIPLSTILSSLVDLAVGLGFLVVFAAAFGIFPSWQLALLPGVLALGLVFLLGIILLLSATNVRYRDVGQAMPFLVQIWLFLSPIAYPLTLLGEPLRTILNLNPLVGIVEAFRWSTVGGTPPSTLPITVSAVVGAATLAAGLVYFSRVERSFADVI